MDKSVQWVGFKMDKKRADVLFEWLLEGFSKKVIDNFVRQRDRRMTCCCKQCFQSTWYSSHGFFMQITWNKINFDSYYEIQHPIIFFFRWDKELHHHWPLKTKALPINDE